MTITIPFEKILPWMRALTQRVMHFMKYVVMQIKARPLFIVVALVVGIGMAVWLSPRAGALWFFFVLFLLYEWENRVFGVCALLCLAACPLLLAIKRDALAEVVAVYAYFFLVMTVALQLIEFKRHPERFPEEEETV